MIAELAIASLLLVVGALLWLLRDQRAAHERETTALHDHFFKQTRTLMNHVHAFSADSLAELEQNDKAIHEPEDAPEDTTPEKLFPGSNFPDLDRVAAQHHFKIDWNVPHHDGIPMVYVINCSSRTSETMTLEQACEFFALDAPPELKAISTGTSLTERL